MGCLPFVIQYFIYAKQSWTTQCKKDKNMVILIFFLAKV